MLKIFRAVALMEGVSYLALFAISMPLKHWSSIPGPNKVVGYIHGGLFIAYIVLAIVLWMERKWGVKKLAYLLLASLLPFGTFYLDREWLSKVAREDRKRAVN